MTLVSGSEQREGASSSGLSRNAVLALIAVTLALHDGEEYLAFPRFLQSLSGQGSGWLPAPALQHSSANLQIALILAAVLPSIFIIWAIVRPRHWLLLAALLVEAVLLVNAFSHMLAAALLGRYVPGLITAVLVNLPFGLYVFRRAVREGWIRRHRAWQLIGVAVLLHVVWLSSSMLARR